MTWWRDLQDDDEGQDIIEFSLLQAFIVLVGVASYVGIAGSVNVIWGVVNGRLAEANQIVNRRQFRSKT